MGLPELATDEVVVVVKGSFNPAVFSPAWLRLQEVIGAVEFDDSEVQIVNAALCSFRTGWLNFQVTRDSLQLSTTDFAEFERVRDAVITILRTLSHTPISAMGINRQVKFPAGSSERWHRIGDEFAPKPIWENIMSRTGLLSLSVQGARGDKYDGKTVVQIAPTDPPKWGVFVSVNNHFTLIEAESQPENRDQPLGQPDDQVEMSADKIPMAIRILAEEWSNALTRAERVVEEVFQQATAKKGRSRVR